MPHFLHYIGCSDDRYIYELAHDLHASEHPPLHSNGIRLSVLEIIDEMRVNIAQGFTYRIEHNSRGKLIKMRMMNEDDLQKEREPQEEPENRTNSLLGNIDAWQEGDVYDPDDETTEEE